MLAEAQSRTAVLQSQMQTQNIPFGVFTDESSIAYLAGFWGYLGIEFGRPTMMVVPAVGSPTVITPLMESEMVDAMTWVEDIRVWEDFGSKSWQAALAKVLGPNPESIWLELSTVPAIVRNYLDQDFSGVPLCDIAPVLGQQRTIKSVLEIEVKSQAGSIAGAMMQAAYKRADPVYFCFCNMAQFKQYKLGFDRMFHIGEITDQAAEV